MNKNRFKLVVGAICTVVLISSVGVGARAYFTSRDTVHSTYKVVKVTTEIDENVDTAGTKDVKIKNTGNAKCYVRARVTISPENSVRTVYESTGSSYNQNDWLEYNGFYYYRKILDVNQSTTSLFTNYEPVEAESLVALLQEDGYFDIAIYQEAIQAMKDENENWLDPVSGDALPKEIMEAWALYEE